MAQHDGDVAELLRLFDAALTTRARAALLNGADRHYDDMAPAYEDAREAEAAFRVALSAHGTAQRAAGVEAAAMVAEQFRDGSNEACIGTTSRHIAAAIRKLQP